MEQLSAWLLSQSRGQAPVNTMPFALQAAMPLPAGQNLVGRENARLQNQVNQLKVENRKQINYNKVCFVNQGSGDNTQAQESPLPPRRSFPNCVECRFGVCSFCLRECCRSSRAQKRGKFFGSWLPLALQPTLLCPKKAPC